MSFSSVAPTSPAPGRNPSHPSAPPPTPCSTSAMRCDNTRQARHVRQASMPECECERIRRRVAAAPAASAKGWGAAGCFRSGPFIVELFIVPDGAASASAAQGESGGELLWSGIGCAVCCRFCGSRLGWVSAAVVLGRGFKFDSIPNGSSPKRRSAVRPPHRNRSAATGRTMGDGDSHGSGGGAKQRGPWGA